MANYTITIPNTGDIPTQCCDRGDTLAWQNDTTGSVTITGLGGIVNPANNITLASSATSDARNVTGSNGNHSYMVDSDSIEGEPRTGTVDIEG